MNRLLQIALATLSCISVSTGVLAGDPSSEAGQSVYEKMSVSEEGGKLTPDQYKASRTSWFEEMDADKDGKLSADEFMKEEFAKLDAPETDGVVTIQEYVIFFVGKENAEQYEEAKARETKSRTEFGHPGMDTNKDGLVGLEEFITLHKGLFDEMDADKDAMVSRDEFDSFRGTRFLYMDADGNGLLVLEEFLD